MDDLYMDSIIDRYKHPTNQGWIEGGEVHKAHNASCGDMFEVSVLYDGEKVLDAKWRGEGCAISTVSVDMFCEWAAGKTRLQITDYSKENVQELTGIRSVAPAREKCLFIPLNLVSNDLRNEGVAVMS